jgi:hypothetical protein
MHIREQGKTIGAPSRHPVTGHHPIKKVWPFPE